MHSEGDGRDRRIAFRLDSGDAVILGPEHPLRVETCDHGPSPRMLVRHGLEAELTRAVYYELAELALAENPAAPGVWSDGVFFPLDEAAVTTRRPPSPSARAAGRDAELLLGDLPELRADASLEAAVLIAITDRRDPGVILTVRREHLRTHAGQIAFPAAASIPAKTPSRRRCARPRRKSCSIPQRWKWSGRSSPIAP